MIIPDYVEKNARLYPDKTAFICNNQRITFSQLKERTYKLANALIQLDVKKGDRVAILSENRIEFPEIFLAIGKIGAIAAPLNFRQRASENAFLMNHNEAKIFLVETDYVEQMQPHAAELKSVKHWVCIGGNHDGMKNYEEIVNSSPSTKPEVEVGMNDLFCIVYTGGTTGKPKGAMLSHRNLHSASTTWVVEHQLVSEDNYLIVGPFFHTSGCWLLFMCTVMGMTATILKKTDPEAILKNVQADNVSGITMMPIIVNMILNFPDLAKYDMSSIKKILVGGGPLGEAQLRKLLELLPGRAILHSGGQTEVGPLSAIRLNEHLNSPRPERIGSAGRDAFNMQLRVVDDKDEDVAPNEVGELVAKGEGVYQGYWGLPEETAEVLKDGWQHTGDLVRIDDERYIYYVDRKKDMIKTGGENVYCKEVEDVIYGHPAIAETAIIGVPDKKWGEGIKALVLLKQGQTLTGDELIEYCKQNLSGFKCPKSVDIVSEFPRTALGKINKVSLRDDYWKGYERRIMA